MKKRVFLTFAGAVLALAGYAQEAGKEVAQQAEAQQQTSIRSYKLARISFDGDKVLATYNGEAEAKTYDMDAVDVKVAMKGDANRDGKVTITDAVSVVNYILKSGEQSGAEDDGNGSENFNFYAADVNESDDITISDAVGVVNIILQPIH